MSLDSRNSCSACGRDLEKELKELLEKEIKLIDFDKLFDSIIFKGIVDRNEFNRCIEVCYFYALALNKMEESMVFSELYLQSNNPEIIFTKYKYLHFLLKCYRFCNTKTQYQFYL